jgi:hypothetical protein
MAPKTTATDTRSDVAALVGVEPARIDALLVDHVDVLRALLVLEQLDALEAPVGAVAAARLRVREARMNLVRFGDMGREALAYRDTGDAVRRDHEERRQAALEKRRQADERAANLVHAQKIQRINGERS